MRCNRLPEKIPPVVLLYSCIYVFSAFNPHISRSNPAFFGFINEIKGRNADQLSFVNIMP